MIKSPWGYFSRVLAVRSGNYHERQHRRAAERMKAELTHAPAEIRALVAGIGGDYGTIWKRDRGTDFTGAGSLPDPAC